MYVHINKAIVFGNNDFYFLNILRFNFLSFYTRIFIKQLNSKSDSTKFGLVSMKKTNF